MATTRTVIVLAAGCGSRFTAGPHKLAAPFDGGRNVLTTTIGQAIASHLHVVVVTTEPFAGLARQSIAARDIVVLPEVGPPGAGARRLVARYPAYGVEIDDPGILIDIDTEEDLASARADLRPGETRAAAGLTR